jgi:hypothetical protein
VVAQPTLTPVFGDYAPVDQSGNSTVCEEPLFICKVVRVGGSEVRGYRT